MFWFTKGSNIFYNMLIYKQIDQIIINFATGFKSLLRYSNKRVKNRDTNGGTQHHIAQSQPQISGL